VTVHIERRLEQPRWLSVAVPIGSIAFAFLVIAVVLAITGHDPIQTYRDLFDSAFTADGALTQTFISATPLLFTGLAAAAAFRMQVWNIGAEGQLYCGAIGASGVALQLGPDASSPFVIFAMVVCGGLAGAAWGLIPGVLKTFTRTNEIITSLMLNYVAGYILTWLIFDSASYWRDLSSVQARSFPQAKPMTPNAFWPTVDLGSGTSSVVIPLGFLIAIGIAVVLHVLYTKTRFGFEVQVIGDSARAARYAGMRTRRKILAVFAISGGIAGIGGASQIGDFAHTLDADPNGLQKSYYGYTGIVVAALGRYNPFAVCLVGFLLGGLQNAGFTLQGADFPSGLVGVMQGLILFCALAGEVLVRYRLRIGRGAPRAAEPQPEAAS
jgi:general nucleoside transport system permease protein